MTQLKRYIVYMHTNKVTGKRYVGITSRSLNTRWCNGNGYRDNFKFYKDILKYGWDAFSHDIIKENLTFYEARELEAGLIEKYNLVNDGYNNTASSISENNAFDYYDFKIINKEEYRYKAKPLLFLRIPNQFIQCDIQQEYGLSRIFYIVWAVISRNRTHEDISRLSLGEIIDLCNYKRNDHKPKVFFEIIKCLLFLETNNYIDMKYFDMRSVTYDDCITIRIISDVFDPKENFTKIYNYQFDTIMSYRDSTTKENLISVFLYIASYIGNRVRNEDGGELTDPTENPEAFWGTVEKMKEKLSMSKKTILRCLDLLTSSTRGTKPLLIKEEVGYIPQALDKPPIQAPNIYVLHKDGYKKEIQLALNKMKQIYSVDHFIKNIPKTEN